MYKNVIDPGKSVSFVLNNIDIGGQNRYVMCTGPLYKKHHICLAFRPKNTCMVNE